MVETSARSWKNQIGDQKKGKCKPIPATEKPNAQAPCGRRILGSLDREFARLYVRNCQIIESTPEQHLYESTPQTRSIGESVLRSAAAIERTFGGITANLWDDPFEWTLPEQLSTKAKISGHLNEVEALRQRAFASFTDDSCLLKHVATPASETLPLIDLLLETLVEAARRSGKPEFGGFANEMSDNQNLAG